MGESLSAISLMDSIKQAFDLSDIDLKTYSPLTLAYIGDSIYALVAKTVIVGSCNTKADKLHKDTVRYVSAKAQAQIYQYFLDEDVLSDEEGDVLRRGRNAKSHHSAKNASIEDYKKATAVEALVGYLYLKNDMERLLNLLKAGFDFLDK